MQTTLSAELYWLTLTIGFTAVMWVPYIINRMRELGFLPAVWDPFGHTEAKAVWANRMMQAHVNAIENLVVFAPLVLLVHFTGQSSILTANACVIYFMARFIHFIAFTLAIPLLRVFSFLTGFYSQVILVLSILSVI